MTRGDVITALTALKTAYPNAFRDASRESAEATVELWTLELKPYPRQVVAEAVRRIIAESKFAPGISEIIAKARAVVSEMQTLTLFRIALGRDVPLAERRFVYGLAQSIKPAENGAVPALREPERSER